MARPLADQGPFGAANHRAIVGFVTAGPIEIERDLKFRKVDDGLALTMAARSVARHRVDSAGST